MQGRTHSSKILCGTSILLIIFNGKAAISWLRLLSDVSEVSAKLSKLSTIFHFIGVFLQVIVMVISAIGLLYFGFNLAVGIIGLINWNKPENGGLCFGFGVTIVLLAAINGIWINNIGNFKFTNLLYLVLPVLYLVGAYQLKKLHNKRVNEKIQYWEYT